MDPSHVDEVMRVSGFGLTENKQISSTLKFTDVQGITAAKCLETFKSLITDSILCTVGYPNANMGTCSGDSGGPLITLDNPPIQVGIVSFGSSQGT